MMRSKLHVMRFLKSDLSHVSSWNLRVPSAESMTISHYAGSVQSAESTLPFTVEAVPLHVPYVKPVEFVLSVRQKVDLSACGSQDVLIKENGDDIGEYNYKDESPHRPVSLPPGFEEVYRKQ